MSLETKIKKNRNEKYKKMKGILDEKIRYHIKFNKNDEIELYNKNKHIITAKYNFYGIIDPTTKTFYWANMIPNITKKRRKIVEKLKEKKDKVKDDLYYSNIMMNDSIYAPNKEDMDKISSLLLYLSDDLYFLNPTTPSGNIQFLFISEITEKYI